MDISGLNIPQGSTVKIAHENCSTSKAMAVSNNLKGYLVYCHKCSYTEFIPHHDSIAEKAKRMALYAATQEVLQAKTYSLPADLSNNIPNKGLSWLGRGGWDTNLIHKYRVQWSEALQRVILPLSVGYTARSVLPNHKPKYIEKCPSDSYWESLSEESNVCVITEDILSAGRVGQFCKSYALNGTTISTSTLAVLKKYNKILLWLDPDKAGLKGSIKAIQRLSLFSEVSVLREVNEPKHMNNNNLYELLRSKI